MTISPSKFTRLDTLLQIRRDNYIGEGGQEYAACEVDTLILEKQNAKAEALAREADRHMHREAIVSAQVAFARGWNGVTAEPLPDEKFILDILSEVGSDDEAFDFGVYFAAELNDCFN